MAALRLPRRHLAQPQAAPRLDLGHPLVQRFHAGVSYAGGHEAAYRCRRLTPGALVGVTGRDDRGGLIHAAQAFDRYANFLFDEAVPSESDEWCVLAVVKAASASGADRRLVGLSLDTTDANTTSDLVALMTDVDGIGGAHRGGSYIATAKVDPGADFIPIALAFRQSDPMTLIARGHPTITTAGTTGFYGGLDVVSSLQLAEATTFEHGAIAAAYYLVGPVSDAELRAWVNDPWQIYAAAPLRLHFSAATGGGSSQNLTASGGAQPGGSATPAATVGLAGVVIAQPGGSATPAAQIALSAADIAVSGGSTNPTVTVTLSAAGLVNAAGSLNLSADVLLAAAAGAQAGGNPTLAATLAAMASGGAQPGGSANPTGATAGDLSVSGGAQGGGSATPAADADLQASAGATPGASPVMSITVSLVATDGAQPGGSANPAGTTAGDLSVSGGAQPGGDATISATVELTAAGFVNAMLTGFLAVQVSLAVADGASPGGSAQISIAGLILLSGRLWTVEAMPHRHWEVRA